MATKSPCACTRVRRAARAVSDVYDEALRGSGLKITQFALLRTVARTDGGSISALADEMALDRSTLGRNLIPLKRRGLVRTSEGDDLRERTISLTAKASRLLERAQPAWERAQARVTEKLGPQGFADLFRLLARLEELR